jgi:excisionase family DNA binding protein
MVRHMSSKRFLTTKEVAELFEVSANTISRWARDGKMPALTTPGGRRKFPREVIQDRFRQLNFIAIDEGR